MKKIILTALIVIVVAIGATAMYVKFALPNVGPAPDISVAITPEHVAHGEYLAYHVTACMDCHSTRDWSRFAGPPEPGTAGKGGEFFGPKLGFPGSFYSRNITPYNLKDWTDGEIFRVITTGVNKDGEAMFPVMPYIYYGRMDKQDIYDIIAYIRTLQPIKSNPPDHTVDFPFNFIINTISHKAELSIKPPTTDTLKYGAYMINAAGCMECHTPVKSGQIIKSKAYSGGRSFDMPGGLTVNSANLTPDIETGIGAWTAEQFIATFKAYQNLANLPETGPGKPNTMMPWTMYAGMDTTDLNAIFVYLKSLKPVKNKVEQFVFKKAK